MKLSFLFLILSVNWGEAGARTLNETFSTRDGYASGSAVWNQELGKVHNTLSVVGYKVAATPLDFDVGDGSDGPFELSTYTRFGTLSGFTLQIDTTLHPVLNVTRFSLDKNYILEPIGGNPLVIRSLSYVRIVGEILCSGFPGADATAGGAGGQGRCGGKAGGAGGSITGAGADGGDSATGIVNITGGRGGNYPGFGSSVGGGGGGTWSSLSPPTDGTGASGAGGLAGQYSSDPEFLSIGQGYDSGGAGGGGGSGDGTSAGGGGGGGGGLVQIFAVGDLDFGSPTETAVGYIKVNGGDGGSGAGGAGHGGGGGGGSVRAFVGGRWNFYNVDLASSQASGGDGGGGGAGAHGGIGRSWFSNLNGRTGTGSYSPPEESPGVTGFNSGYIEFVSSSQSVVTTIYDTLAMGPLISLQFSPSSTDFTAEVAGSNDNFVVDDTGWNTSLASVSGKRYLRFRYSVDTTDVYNPSMIDSATATFLTPVETQFDFQAAGCGRVEGGRGGHGGNLLLLLLAPLWLLVLKLKAQRNLPRK